MNQKIDDKYDGYLALAAAVLRQAADDYIDALQAPETRASLSQILMLEKFFRSGWGQLLSLNQGEYIINKCRRDAQEQKRDNSSQKK